MRTKMLKNEKEVTQVCWCWRIFCNSKN